MWNRDSLVWTIAALSALVGYLLTADGPPTVWDYKEWLNFASFALVWVTGKMATSPQPGENDGNKTGTRRISVVLLPLLLAGSLVAPVALSGCAGSIKPPVITTDDQAQVRAVASKALGGIEIAGVVVRDSRQLVSDLTRAGVLTTEFRSTVNNWVIESNDVVQRIIGEIAAATRQVDVRILTQQVATHLNNLAALLERYTDGRIQTAGMFLRSAVVALVVMAGGAQ